MTDAADEFFEMLHDAEEGPEGDLDPRAAVRGQCDQWVQLAMALRFSPDRWPGAQASPSDVKDALVDVRSRLDQMENLLVSVMALRSGSAAGAREAEQRAEDAWDRQAEAERHRPRPEYQGSRERYAYWNLAIRAERANAREARDLADYVRGIHDVIRVAYDGLNETRRDLVSRLTHFRWESNLEH